jgi:general secretion pathway protein I
MTRRPFTLVEVIVALVVAAVILPIALRALMTAGGLDESSAQRRQAARLADLKLRELVVTGDWIDAEDTGDFGDDYPGYTWDLVADEWIAGDVALRQLALSVRGPGRYGANPVTLVTLVPEPED